MRNTRILAALAFAAITLLTACNSGDAAVDAAGDASRPCPSPGDQLTGREWFPTADTINSTSYDQIPTCAVDGADWFVTLATYGDGCMVWVGPGVQWGSDGIVEAQGGNGNPCARR